MGKAHLYEGTSLRDTLRLRRGKEAVTRRRVGGKMQRRIKETGATGKRGVWGLRGEV